MTTESEETSDKIDYSVEHLNQIKSMLSNNNKAVEELSENLKFLKEREELLTTYLTSKDPTAMYISLHHSKQRAFIDNLTFIADLCKNPEKYKELRDSNSPSRLKRALEKEAATHDDNIIKLRELDSEFDRLKSLNDSIQKINVSYNSSSL